MSSASSKIPVVFISSTSEDLSEYRTAARDAVLAAKFHPRMMEYFMASGERAPLAACLHEVDQTDLLVVIVAHRYGWVPGEQAAGEFKSITWLECERAHASGKEVLAFLLDEHHAWPEEKKEEWAVTVAIREDRETPELLAEVKRNRKLLKEFKNWLNSLGIRAQYTTPESLGGKVSAALNDWRQRHPDVEGIVAATPIPKSDPLHYLDYLLRRTAYIELRDLKIGKGEAKRFPIEDLYIELSTPVALEAERPSSKSKRKKGDAKTADGFQAVQRNVSQRLQRLLGPGCRVVIVGDPGAGKTTFLRRIANAFCETRLGRVPNAAESRLGIARAPFPIFVRVAELAGYIQGQSATPTAAQPTALDSPEWLLHFLEAKSAEDNCPLLRPFWRDTLNAGGCLLLDGLDEAPDAQSRAAMARLAEHLATVYRESWLVITSRPAAYKDDSVIPGFQLSRVEPLTESAAITFLRRWSEALFQEDPEHARKHREELVGAIAARREIRQMARNPVMLTALAVVHWNDKRLPEQRAELYESIIHWLARSREERRGRLSAEQCVRLSQELALAMQTDQKGRRVQVAKRWAAEILALQFPSTTPPKRTKSAKGATRTSPAQIAAAEAFLDAEELDSGIVVARGNELCFWHLSFQEYLVAKAIAARAEADQRDLLWNNRRYFYQPEWREVVLLLGGGVVPARPPKG